MFCFAFQNYISFYISPYIFIFVKNNSIVDLLNRNLQIETSGGKK